ncbi:MAG: M20/M25/M40 family metallo-hydrolase [Phycisphaerales bacterium JB050]
MSDTATLDRIFEALKNNEDAAIQRLMDWLRIPSISTDSKYRSQCSDAAQWAVDRLADAGIEAELIPTGSADQPGHPIVWAEYDGAPDYQGPHVLFYGHYDVQPPDPLELWESPPFEPVIKEADGPLEDDVPQKRIVARGAVDDKGQVASFLEALRAWKEQHGAVPIRLTVLLEGEEESGSVNLDHFVRDNKAKLEKCDICVISDTGQLARGKPAITTGVRGMAYTNIVLHSADQDLHSGMWGGKCPNPINELTKVLSQLWDVDRKVTIPGFYDDVRPISDEEKEAWSRVPQDPVASLKKIGLPPEADVGEKGFSALEREWARPTADINGIWGGYQGEGAKTVIPAYAGAKVSFRLVADQDPEAITQKFFAWLEERTPPGCRWELTDLHGGHPGNVSADSPYLKAAMTALEVAGGTTPHLIKSGGSIPVVGLLKAELGLDTLLIGFGLEDDRVHSPNEKFEIDCFTLGMRTHAALIGEFAGQ